MSIMQHLLKIFMFGLLKKNSPKCLVFESAKLGGVGVTTMVNVVMKIINLT